MILAFALLLYAFVFALCACVTFTGRDAWPFPAYPMSADYRAPAAMEFHRLCFVGERAAEDLTESVWLFLGPAYLVFAPLPLRQAATLAG